MTTSYNYQISFFRESTPLSLDEIDNLRQEVRRIVGEAGLHNTPHYDRYIDDSLTLEFTTPFFERFIENMYMPFFNFLARGVKDIAKVVDRMNNDDTKEVIEMRVHINPDIILHDHLI